MLATRCVRLQAVANVASSSARCISSEARPVSDIPSPAGALPVLGHLHLIRRGNGKQRFDRLAGYINKLGPIVNFKLPGNQNMVLIRDADSTEAVFRTEGKYPVRSSSLSETMRWFWNKQNIPVTFAFLDGEEWKTNRSLHHKQIRPVNVHSYCPGLNKATDRLLRKLQSSRDEEGYVKDIHQHVMNWTMEASAWFSMGMDLDIGKSDDTEAAVFQKATMDLVSSFDTLTQALPFYKIYPTPTYKKARDGLNNMHRIGRKLVDKNREAINQRVKTKGSVEGLSLIEQWLIEGKMSEEECISSAITMLSAGVDTTANSGTFMLYELAKSREVQDKIREQVVSVLGENGEADVETLQNMPYLMNVIKESARLNPITQFTARELNCDIELMGYNIPEKTLIAMMNCGNLESYFNNPEKFNPDRWDKSGPQIHPFAILPFGFGPRSCFGRRFADLELKLLLIKMCRHFVLETDDPPNARLPYDIETLVRPTGDVRLKLSLR